MARPKEKEVVITKTGQKRVYKINKEWKKKTWRPKVITPEVVQKLEDLLSQDVSIEVACKFVGISERAYYYECENNPQFLQKMEKAQEYVGIIAWRTIAKAIRDGDTQTAKRYKERRDDRYKQKPTQINMQQGIDPETWEATQWLMVEFTLKD